MKKLILAISVFLLFGSSFANEEHVYYCASEIAAGIYLDQKTGKWSGSGFAPARYTVKFNSNYTKVKGILNNKENWGCSIPFLGIAPKYKDTRVCIDSNYQGALFTFDKKTLRFLFAFAGITGYLATKKEPDSNMIYGGKCQKF